MDDVGSSGPDYEIPPKSVMAIEIFSRGQVPAEFDTGRDALCGVIVVWTEASLP
jgi:hypothetical protein